MARIGLDKSARAFTTLPTIDGYDVIDTTTGRAMDHRETKRSASGRAFVLNEAAKVGPRALAQSAPSRIAAGASQVRARGRKQATPATLASLSPLLPPACLSVAWIWPGTGISQRLALRARLRLCAPALRTRGERNRSIDSR